MRVYKDGMNLKQWLASSGMTQEELAKTLKVNRTTVCHLVAGRKTPSLSLALRIEEFTKVVKTDSWVRR